MEWANCQSRHVRSIGDNPIRGDDGVHGRAANPFCRPVRAGGGWELTLNAPNVLPNAVRLRTYTRWITEGGQDLPRELIVEV